MLPPIPELQSSPWGIMRKKFKRTIWLRHESKPFEERTALTPTACKTLLTLGHQVIVEASPNRIFKFFSSS